MGDSLLKGVQEALEYTRGTPAFAGVTEFL